MGGEIIRPDCVPQSSAKWIRGNRGEQPKPSAHSKLQIASINGEALGIKGKSCIAFSNRAGV
jgi:hypothetical protein